jgi:hypothetical protein
VPAIGFGVVWFGWAVTSWGYCLVKGYPVKFTDWINPLHPYSGAWPPPGTIPTSEVFPGVTVGSAGGATELPDPTAPAPGPAKPAGTATAPVTLA